MLVKHSLLFIGSLDESFNELIDRLKNDFTIHTCGCTSASVQFYTDNYAPDLVVCSLEHCDMDVLREAVGLVEDMLVVFPSERSSSVKELQDLGLKHFTFTTEHQTAAERYIRMFCKAAKIKAKVFRERKNKLVYDNANSFSSSHCKSGLFYVVEAVKYVLFTEGKYISLRKDIYPYLSRINGSTQASIDNAVRRYVDYVYQKYENEKDSEFFLGSFLELGKPTNKDFILEFSDRIFFKYRDEFYRYFSCIEADAHKKESLRI